MRLDFPTIKTWRSRRTLKVRASLGSSVLSRDSASQSSNGSTNTLSLAQMLPDDILDDIFYFLYLDYDQETLAACALVCHAWSCPSTAFLLSCINIPWYNPPSVRGRSLKWAKVKACLGIMILLRKIRTERPASTRRRTVQQLSDAVSFSPRLTSSLRDLYISAEAVDFLLLQSVVSQLDGLRGLKVETVSFLPIDMTQTYVRPATRRPIEVLSLLWRCKSDALIGRGPDHDSDVPLMLDVLLWFSSCDILTIEAQTGAQSCLTNLWRRQLDSPGHADDLATSRLALHHVQLHTYDFTCLIGWDNLADALDLSALESLDMWALASDLPLVNRFLFEHGQSLQVFKLLLYAGPILPAGSPVTWDRWFNGSHGLSDMHIVVPTTPYPFLSACTRLHTVKLRLRVDFVSSASTSHEAEGPTLFAACRAVWEAYVADLASISTLRKLQLAFSITKDLYNPAVELLDADVHGAISAFLSSLDWSVLDNAESSLEDLDVLLCTRNFADDTWASLSGTEHTELVRARLPTRVRKVLRVVDTYD